MCWPHAWPAASSPGPAGPGDPWPPASPGAGPGTARTIGVQEALKTPGTRLICITGVAGIGKTRLAIDIVTESQAKLAAAALPGISALPLLTVGLRSAQLPTGMRRLALTAHDALLDLLLALGVPEHDIPATREGRHARYLAELTELHPVVLIDDVVTEEQVKPLLPVEGGVVVITSRHRVSWSSVPGVVNVPVAPLSMNETSALVRDVFRAHQAEPDGVMVEIVHEVCGGTPLPVILVSRWLAATGQPLTSLSDARHEWIQAHGDMAGTGVGPGFPAVAAMLGLLAADQQAIVRMFGMLRLPEADLGAVCAATGLGRDRAATALRELTRMGLLASTQPGQAWAMAPGVLDHATGWAGAADPDPAESQRVLDRLLGCYEQRVRGLLDAHAALARADAAGATEWAAGELLAAGAVVAAVLDASARVGSPGRARTLAADYLAATDLLGGRPARAQETERFIGPVLAVARAVDDDELAAGALERLSMLERLSAPADLWTEELGDNPAVPAGPQTLPAESPAEDSLSSIQGEPGDPEVPGPPVLFGAKA